MSIARRSALLALAALCAPVAAQWDPQSGLWGKAEQTDLRVMTWNVQDAICSTNPRKVEGANDWSALARVVAALRPDVLILQEAGDNSGNGSGSGVDSAAMLTETLRLFLVGGTDRFGNTVTSYVAKFSPDYDLPHIFASGADDSYNRNVILSRYPFADLNGDGLTTLSTPVIIRDLYAPGGSGGIRGFQFAEIDLPDETYAGDIVVGNAHLKAGGNSSDLADRLAAAQNVVYMIEFGLNGENGVADPRNKIPLPSASIALPDHTPVVYGGDLNEDETRTGRRGPVSWLSQAEFAGAADGPDRDGSDNAVDNAVQPISGDRTTQSGSKLDHLIWQDSIATARRTFIFNSSGSGMSVSKLPVELHGFPVSPVTITNFASDHRPVIVDLILPTAEAPCPVDRNGDEMVTVADLLAFLGSYRSGAADFNGDGGTDVSDLLSFLGAYRLGC